MSATEALQLQVDNLRHQLYQLQVENEKLRVEVSTGQGEGTAEVEQLREEVIELRQSLHEAQEREVSSNELLHKSRGEYNELKSAYDVVEHESERLMSNLDEYQARYEQTREELSRLRDTAEGERHRALEEERVKWERREATLYTQLEIARAGVISGTGTVSEHVASEKAVVTSAPSPMEGFARTIEIPHVLEAASVVVSSGLRVTASAFTPVPVVSSLPMSAPLCRPMGAPLSAGVAMTAATNVRSRSLVSSSLRSSANVVPPVSTTVFVSPLTPSTRFVTTVPPVAPVHPAASQLPPISKFKGEDPDQEGGSFEEWIEQFELIAEAYGWDSRTRLVNLTTRLQGQAYTFYQTCSPEQRADYTGLKAQLMTRFTPVRLQAVHSNLFHQCKQEEAETVDQYAQELRKLFYRAYPRASQATEEAEGFGRSVLAYQFVAGLKQNLQSKVAGVEGDFEQLLLRARFEEAKIRDLTFQSDRRPGSGNSFHNGLRRSTPAG